MVVVIYPLVPHITRILSPCEGCDSYVLDQYFGRCCELFNTQSRLGVLLRMGNRII